MGNRLDLRLLPRLLPALLGAAVVAWIAYKATQNSTQFVTVSLNGLTLAALDFGTIVIGAVGLAMQQVLLRWNQGQDLRQALLTIALSVILADQMLAHFGGIAQSIQQPTPWPNSVPVLGTHYGFFRLVI